MIGLYFGKKPHDLVKSLQDFVKDLLHFLQHGISQSGLHYEIEVDSFVIPMQEPLLRMLKYTLVTVGVTYVHTH